MLYPIFNMKSPIPVKTKLQLFHMYVRSVIVYADQARASFVSHTSLSKLEAVQNIGLRTILSASPYIRIRTLLDSTGLTSIREYIQEKFSSYVL